MAYKYRLLFKKLYAGIVAQDFGLLAVCGRTLLREAQ